MKILMFLLGFMVCLTVIVALNAWRDARTRKKWGGTLKARNGTTKEETKLPKVQTTKIIVFSILLSYHIAFLIGIWVVVAKDYYQLSTLLAYVGSAAVLAVGFYCWKSKAENLLKIRQNAPDLVGSLSDFANMTSQ